MKTKHPTGGLIDLETMPGHFIRRLQQIAVAVFLEQTEPHGITPVQYAVLQTVRNSPNVDQRTLAGSIGFDTSTTAGVIDRLETRGLLLRNASADDKRVRLLTLTQKGGELLDAVIPGMLQAQVRMLAPLTEKQRAEFMKALRILVKANNSVSRAPAQRESPG
jgi:MarR family transcriptional regulator, lower aerobic nicotinate degradation pathway regulator